MIESILVVLGAGLKLWNHENAVKYKKKFYKLKKDYYEESNKERPDNAVLDELEFELHLLGKCFATEINQQTSDTL